MEIVDGVFKDVVRISSHEVDQQNSIHPSVYLLMMQEAAGFHAYQKNLSIPQLMKEGKVLDHLLLKQSGALKSPIA